jgi:mRNA interferase RelE/StbE
VAKVQLTADAVEDLRDLDGSTLKMVLKALKKLEDHPEQRGEPLGSRQQTGNLTGFRKLVVGNRSHRIVYQVLASGDVCVVWVIAGRVDDVVYEIAVARVKLHADPPISTGLQKVLANVFGHKTEPPEPMKGGHMNQQQRELVIAAQDVWSAAKRKLRRA